MRFLRRILRPFFCCSALSAQARSGELKLVVPHSAVVYFSHTGNASKVAGRVAEITEADLFEIISRTQYPKAYYPTTRFVKKEIESGVLPDIEPITADLATTRLFLWAYPLGGAT